MIKHTEGPWVLVPHDMMSNGVKMYFVNQQTSIATTNEVDARLIAVSPELLEALERIIADDRAAIDHDDYVFAKQAIAKAKGD